MTLRVRVSSRAERDADTIFDWLAERSLDGAAHWYERYLATLHSLPDRAEECPTAPEADHLGLDLRQALFQTLKGRVYRSLFIIRESIIHIVSVRGAGQDLVSADDLEIPE